MGTVATITSGVLAGATLTGVFGRILKSKMYAAGGVRLRGQAHIFGQIILTVHPEAPDTPTIFPGDNPCVITRLVETAALVRRAGVSRRRITGAGRGGMFERASEKCDPESESA